MDNTTERVAFPPIYGIDATKRYPNVRISIETITPEIAEKMLLTNIDNRDPKREAIKKAILSGEWTLNGATIVFDENGNLTDGQNRLRACVAANVPIDTLVVRGIPRAAQITMDTGIKRSLTDYLKLKGLKNYTTVGSMGMMIYRANTYGLQSAFTMPTAGKDTLQTVYEYICKEYDTRIEPLISSVMAIRAAYGVEAGTLGALLDAFSRAGSDNLNEFVSQLLNRKPACTAVRLLQDKLHKNKEKKDGKLPQKVIAALIIKSWNAYMLGDDIKLLRFTLGGANPESFPEIFLDFD